MRIHFNGAARTVTGSQHLIEANGARILLDCGLFQGRRAETYERNRTFRFDPTSIDAVLLSHAHIDHSGNLPHLVKHGYSGPIYATAATASLTEIMLLDSGHIQEADVQYVNKRRKKRGEPPIEPLYTQEDAARVAEFLRPIPYNQLFEAGPGVTAEFIDAGHILGSAAIRLMIRENGRTTRLWFSGDIGRPGMPIIRDPILPDDVDYLLMECTYGDRPHRDPELAHREFAAVVKRTVQRGGKVIVPAFAVGRTQDLVYTLNMLIRDGLLPAIPVFVDSPLAVRASQIFLKHPECYDAETLEFIREEKHPALNFPGLTYVTSVDESKALNERKDPMVIISASGMAEAGRILHHLKNNIDQPNNTILIISWQAPNTLGRRLAERQVEVRIFGETYHRKADIATIGGLSAHAGQDLLVRYAQAVGKAKGILLVHGEEDAATALREKLEEVGIKRVVYPDLHTTIDL
ncbi:MAG: MBL fold metallo-hydrolase [Anaerolineales bacterium]|nr:MBL fold metallo-hydrolase [Anaerolineales bacterium]